MRLIKDIKKMGKDSNGKIVAIFDIVCDTESDLPAANQYSNDGLMICQSSRALVIDTATKYMMQSDGTWTIQNASTAAYTKAETDALIASAVSDAVTDALDKLLGMGERLPDTGIDADDYTTPGVYRMQTTAGAGLSTHIPRTDLAFKLKVEYINNNNRILQTFTPLAAAAPFYRRVKTSGGWQYWYIFEGVSV